MKILHTGDWHLGKKLDHYSRLEEQEQVMNEIIAIADSENVDLVLVAGDLFDTFNPPVEAVELFYKTLKTLSGNGKRAVVAIAGNHDSPSRIDAPDPLARSSGIILIGHPKAIVREMDKDLPFSINQSDEGFIELIFKHLPYPVRLIHTAYANETRLRQYLDVDQKEQQLNDAIAQHWKDLSDKYCDDQGVNLLMTHLYILNRNIKPLEEPDGEKPLRLGNADLIYSDHIPKNIQYTALGHLHQYIPLAKDDKPINYSGSPLAYSFSEAGQQKHVIITSIQPNNPAQVTRIPLISGRQLERVRFDSISTAEKWLIDNPYTLVELTIESDEYLTAQEISILRKAHDGIIHLIPIVKNQEALDIPTKNINLDDNIESLFTDYFTSRMGQKPNEDIMDIFKQLI